MPGRSAFDGTRRRPGCASWGRVGGAAGAWAVGAGLPVAAPGAGRPAGLTGLAPDGRDDAGALGVRPDAPATVLRELVASGADDGFLGALHSRGLRPHDAMAVRLFGSDGAPGG